MPYWTCPQPLLGNNSCWNFLPWRSLCKYLQWLSFLSSIYFCRKWRSFCFKYRCRQVALFRFCVWVYLLHPVNCARLFCVCVSWGIEGDYWLAINFLILVYNLYEVLNYIELSIWSSSDAAVTWHLSLVASLAGISSLCLCQSLCLMAIDYQKYSFK